MDSEMDVGSSSGTVPVAVPQTMATASGPPYRRRARNAVLNDPALEQVMGTKEKALDVEEFPEDSPPNLDCEDQRHWAKIRKVLFGQEIVEHTTKYTHPRSWASHLAHARQTLRMLQDVSVGIREKFAITGCMPRRPRNKITKSKAKARTRRTKSTNARDKRPSQHTTTNSAVVSPSDATQDDATDAMDYTSGDAALDSVEDGEFETPEQRLENDRAMRQMAMEIREEHPALRDITPDTMTRIAHFVDLGVW